MLLFYENLRQDLETQGFAINPYDQCVAIKRISGSQVTVVWHVNDNKISHKHPWEVTKWLHGYKNIW